MQLRTLIRKLQQLQCSSHRTVCIDKSTFRHPCEADGMVILDIKRVSYEWVPMLDEDGCFSANADGTERGRYMVVLRGANDNP